MQKDKLMALFEKKPSQWIPLPEILQLGIAQYNARIYDLRREGYKIDNMLIRVANGERHTAFKYEPRKEK